MRFNEEPRPIAKYFCRCMQNGEIRIHAVEPFVWHDKEKIRWMLDSKKI
jgi:hypothetical protein